MQQTTIVRKTLVAVHFRVLLLSFSTNHSLQCISMGSTEVGLFWEGRVAESRATLDAFMMGLVGAMQELIKIA